MNYSRILFGIAILFCFGANAQQQSEERKLPNTTPNNSLENPASYADRDHYKIAKAKGSLIYGRDYIFEGMSASEVSQQLIDTVDPYNYLNYFRAFEKVYIDLQEHGFRLILFPTQTSSEYQLNENE